MEEKNIREREILQIGAIDVWNETLFSMRKKLPVNRGRLTLVIGCGGSGAAAVKQAVRMARQKLDPDFGIYMKFMLVDTDTGEIERTEREFGGTIMNLNISTPGAPERLAYQRRSDFHRTFMPKFYCTMPLDNYSPGRNRLYAKAKFYDQALRGGYNDTRFRDMIQQLFKGEWSVYRDLDVDIMILAGLAGGTGSGIFEEVAAHAREACLRAGAQSISGVFGYLFLPDTVEELVRHDTRCYANGYAALKELESYMSISFNSERKEYFCSNDGFTRIECSSSMPLFTDVILLSGGYKETSTMMAEYIVSLAVQNERGFYQKSLFYCRAWNIDTCIRANDPIKNGLLDSDFFPEDSHQYSGIGYAHADIPKEVVTANIVGNVCKKLYEPIKGEDSDVEGTYFCTNEHGMSEKVMESQLRWIFGFGKEEVTERSLWEQRIKAVLDMVSRPRDNDVELRRSDIVHGEIETYRKGFREEECIIRGISRMSEILKDIFKQFLESSCRLLRSYGPRAMVQLYDSSIHGMLEYVKEEMCRIISQHIDEPRYGTDLPRPILLFFGFSFVCEWKGEFRDAVHHRIKQNIARAIMEPNGLWEREIIKLMEDYVNQCREFADRLEVLKDFYYEEGKGLENGKFDDFLKKTGKGNYVNLCSDSQAYSWIQAKVRESINNVDVNKVRGELIRSFVENPSVWTSDVVGETRKEFDRIMAQYCSLGAAENERSPLTVTTYFNDILGSLTDDSALMAKAHGIAAQIVQPLLEKSKPSLHKRQDSVGIIERFVLIPKALIVASYGTAVLFAFKEELRKRGVDAGVLLISSVPEIVCYQGSVGDALCDLRDIGIWEKAYNEYSDRELHLIDGEPQYAGSYCEQKKSELADVQLFPEEDIVFGTGLSLKNYPPVALHNLQNNKKEQAFLEEVFNPIVDYALKEKIIERRTDSNTYKHKYVINLIPQGWKNLDVEDYDTIGHDGKYKRGETLFRYLKEQNRSVVGTYQKAIRLEGRGYMGEEYDFTEAKMLIPGMTEAKIEEISIAYMKRKLRKNTALFLELRETLCRYYDIAKELEYKEKEQKCIYLVKRFIEYYRYDLIFEEGDNGIWYYLKNSGGAKATLSSFGFNDQRMYGELEKKLLERGWKFLLAYKKFEEKELVYILDELLEERLGEDPEEMEELSRRNGSKLYELSDFIKRNIMDNRPVDMEEEDWIRRAFREMGAPADEYYVKTLANMWRELPKLPRKREEDQVDSWICPKCGKENPDAYKFCPLDGERKPQKEIFTKWKCPVCGNMYPAAIKLCPIDMTSQERGMKL